MASSIDRPRSSGSQRQPPSTTIPATSLQEAAKRVADAWESRLGDVVELDVVRGILQTIVEATTLPPDTTQPNIDRVRSVLGRRLLELLRAEIVRDWIATDPDKLEPEELVTILGGLEAVRIAAEPEWDRHFANQLAGPNGLALAVEVAHDLRSPLTSILFLAETMQRGQSGPINDLQRRQLGLVYSAALGLSTVTSNVIELARGGDRLADTQPAPFSVSELMESVRDIVQPMAEEKGLTIRLFPPTSDHRWGHPHAISRVLLNLTTNALKFTENGFVEIVTREPKLHSVEFSVRDTGPGINPPALATLYSPFRPTRGGERHSFSGTGLGLALSRRLVEAMGSKLEVESREHWGTRFYFELELRSVE